MKVFTALATAALLASPVGAQEIKTLKGGFAYLPESHSSLVESINNAGISISVNVGAHCNGQHDGFYSPPNELLAICQDNAPRPHWSEVRWTENDLDTLRHEGHHLAQDCAADRAVGGQVALFFDDKEKYQAFITRALTEEQMERIIETYKAAGADEFTILMELEAFSVADSVSPDTIAGAIDRFCF